MPRENRKKGAAATVNVTSVKKKPSVRWETSAVSSVRVMIVHPNRHRKPLHPLSHQSHEVDVCRKKKKRQRRKSDWQNSSTTVQILFCKVLVRGHFV